MIVAMHWELNISSHGVEAFANVAATKILWRNRCFREIKYFVWYNEKNNTDQM